MSKRTTIGDWLDRMEGCGNDWRRITPHDLRSTCKSGCPNSVLITRPDSATSMMPWRVWMRCTTRPNFISHRLAAAEKWLGFLRDIEAGKESATVIQLQNAA